MAERPIVVDPVVIMFKDRGKLTTHLHAPPDWDHRTYGLAIADLIRHVANAYGVVDRAVLLWVEKEMDKPTTEISTRVFPKGPGG